MNLRNQKSDQFSFPKEVLSALSAGAPVVALESTIISHGLPRPENLRVAIEVEETVGSRDAVPATIPMLEGRVHIGLSQDNLEQIATRDDVIKTSIRDLSTVAARKSFAATTVAATSHLANLAGISVFATGGLGRVHRHARETWDESADLTALSQIPITIVCSAVKSILDVSATLERLETLNIEVVVYTSHQFPGLFLSDSGITVDWSLSDSTEIADVVAARRSLSIRSGLVIAHPLPAANQLDPDLHDQVLAEGLKLADSKKITGKEVTPFLLDHFHRATHGQSLVVNTEIIVRNAELAARIAVADSGTATGS